MIGQFLTAKEIKLERYALKSHCRHRFNNLQCNFTLDCYKLKIKIFKNLLYLNVKTVKNKKVTF